MRKMVMIFLLLAGISAAAGEREELLKQFAVENAGVTELYDKAMKMVEITSAAGYSCKVAEKQLFRAVDHKIRHTENAEKRLEILKKFHTLSREVQQIYSMSREGRGSMAGMQIYGRIACLQQQQIAILMLDDAEGERWEKIGNARLNMDGKEIRLTDGRAEFDLGKEQMEIILFPKDTFSWQNRDFAVISRDVPLAGNDEYSAVRFYEFKDGSLVLHTACKNSSFSRWEVKNGQVIFYDYFGRKVFSLQI